MLNLIIHYYRKQSFLHPYYRSGRLTLSIVLLTSMLLGGVALPALAEPLSVKCFLCFADQSTVGMDNQGPYFVSVGDIDSDGDIDGLSTSLDDDKVAWYENTNSLGTSWTKIMITTSQDWPTAVEPADFDGDNVLDVVVSGQFDDLLAWYENSMGDGSVWTKHTITTTANGPTSLYPIDLDDDNDIDVVTSLTDDDTVAWYENSDGVGVVWHKHDIYAAADGVYSVFVADIDDDNDPDVISGAYNDNTVNWYENDNGNASSWTTHMITNGALGARSVNAADFDGDSDLDVLVSSQTDGIVAWYENTAGDGSAWTQHIINAYTIISNSWGVYPGDFDQDGDFDVAGVSTWGYSQRINWYENQGASWVIHTLAYINQSYTLRPADLDNDSDLEILFASRGAQMVGVFRNLSGHLELAGTDTSPGVIASGGVDDLIKLTAVHKGQSGDDAVELVRLALLLEEDTDDPLTSTEANALIKNLYVYLDDGSGEFEAGSDTLVKTLADLSLAAGVQMVNFSDNDGNVAVSFGTPRTYFVVVEAEEPIIGVLPSTLRLTSLAQDGSTVENAATDDSLRLACAQNLTANPIQFKETSIITLEDAPDPSLLGATVTFTATVTSGSPTGIQATGEVEFTFTPESRKVIKIDEIKIPLVNGVAVLTRSDLSPGYSYVTANYLGDSSFAPSQSLEETHLVNAYGLFLPVVIRP